MFLIFLLPTLLHCQVLLHAQIYIRHGVRTQYFGRWNPSNLSSEDLGSLSATGIYQMYKLGQTLKAEYIDKYKLVSVGGKHNLYYIRCTDISRSLMSTHVLSYAMFEDTSEEIHVDPIPSLSMEDVMVNRKGQKLPFGYQPVAFHTVPATQDHLLLGWDSISCPVIKLLNSENQHSREMKQTALEWQPFFHLLRGKGVFINGIVDGGETADDIFSSILNGERVPPLSQNEIQALDYLRSIYQQMTDFNHYNQVRFQATPFIHNLLKLFETHKDTKMAIYVGHDNNLFQILNLLNLTSWQCINEAAVTQFIDFQSEPHYHFSLVMSLSYLNLAIFWITQPSVLKPYLSYGRVSIFFNESNKDSEKEINNYETHFVKFKFNGEYYPLCHERLLSCPLYKFYSQLQALAFPDYQEKCQIQSLQHDEQQSTVMTFTILLLILSFLFVIVGLNYSRQITLDQQIILPSQEYELRDRG